MVYGQSKTQDSQCKEAAELLQQFSDPPLSLNASLVSQVLDISPSTAYELMHEPDFPVLRVGNRMVVPKEKLTQWVDAQSGGVR